MDKTQKEIVQLRNIVLKVLKDKTKGFYLAGGTALFLYYLHHRESFDLDFFTKDFSEKKINSIISEIENSLGRKAIIVSTETSEDMGKMERLYIPLDPKNTDVDDEGRSLKIDFVEDVYRYIVSKDIIKDGIFVLSQEDIYLRKIYAACGVVAIQDEIGRKRFIGGRQEAKDLFDLYFLSKDFIGLSEFVDTYCPEHKEKVITWYHSFNRIDMKFGLNEIVGYKQVEFQEIERYFKSQIDALIEKEL